ncbi:hypothetical protein MUK42_35231 [Musa troglodytarum]|uniref:Secreted protein n=1 Tax=Musa troglodytarum TaxID=320322 RepID=A0A9E7EDY2_9LILI|nr:hypothetical protein MUK42_35231 [Musa troglodytarum]
MGTCAACGRTMTDLFGFVTETWIVLAHFTIPCATARTPSEHKGGIRNNRKQRRFLGITSPLSKNCLFVITPTFCLLV